MNTNFALEQPEGASVQFLGAVCNSRLLSWVYEQYFGALRMSGGYFQFQAPQLKVLPIRRISFDTPADERVRLREKGQALYTLFCTKGEVGCVLGFVNHHLPRLPDGTPDSTNE